MLFKHKIQMCASSQALKDFPESSVLSISNLIALWSENALSVTWVALRFFETHFVAQDMVCSFKSCSAAVGGQLEPVVECHPRPLALSAAEWGAASLSSSLRAFRVSVQGWGCLLCVCWNRYLVRSRCWGWRNSPLSWSDLHPCRPSLPWSPLWPTAPAWLSLDCS